MIKLTIESKLYTNFECVLSDIFRANDLLNMLSSIPDNNNYSVKNIEIETDKQLIGREYDVRDNSYCINLCSGECASLVQKKDKYYTPDAAEDGAKFIIVKNPYIKKVINDGIGSFYHIFINVVSTKTGNFYRVTYNESCVYAQSLIILEV